MEYHNISLWCFPGGNKKFEGKLSLYEKNNGTLILIGESGLLDEFICRNAVDKNKSKKYVCLWGTIPGSTPIDNITIEGIENHIHIENQVSINIRVLNCLQGHLSLRLT